MLKISLIKLQQFCEILRHNNIVKNVIITKNNIHQQ